MWYFFTVGEVNIIHRKGSFSVYNYKFKTNIQFYCYTLRLGLLLKHKIHMTFGDNFIANIL